MAGVVKADRWTTATSALVELVPRPCPVKESSHHMACCMALGKQSGHFNVCPFFYGLRILRGGTVYDVRWSGDFQAWLHTHIRVSDQYEVLCLRKESANVEAGARYRP